MDLPHIRNFAIIAHIDHGKSTLADCFLRVTKTVPESKMQPQYLDRLSLERERGITIKMQPVRMAYKGFEMNLIDTPGHIDFAYEVSRALKAVEGAILLVDGTQGIQAQTLSHLKIAKEFGLAIIPVINKIDLHIPDLSELVNDISKICEIEKEEDIHLISAKTGDGIEKLLDEIIQLVPSPKIESEKRALIFDSHFDSYKGIVAHVRIFGGNFTAFENIFLKSNNAPLKTIEVGRFSPEIVKEDQLCPGEVGYIATGIKDPDIVKIGDTFVSDISILALEGYKEPQPVIFASVFPGEQMNFEHLKENINKLRLNDSSIKLDLSYSPIFGRGYLIGCMGLLHLEIFQERLKREFETSLILTLPSLEYHVTLTDGQYLQVQNASELPESQRVKEIQEPWAKASVFTPFVYIEKLFTLIKQGRGVILGHTQEGSFSIIECEIPLEELITGLFDELKSISSGYASLQWELLEYRPEDLQRLDILVAEEMNAAFSRIVVKSKAERLARKILIELKDLIPRQQFPIKLQAAIGGKIIARETIPAYRADVTGKLYGGDVTRKNKLLDKQKRGKKKLTSLGKGRVQVSNDVLIKILKVR